MILYKKIITSSVIASFMLLRCSNPLDKYEIINSRISKNKTIYVYTVYSPDTNWSDICKFSQLLIAGKGNVCAVGFFNDRKMVPQIDTNFNLHGPENFMNHLIGTYRFEDGEYKLVR